MTDKSNLQDAIKEVLETKADPLLKSHFGGVELVGFEDGIVSVRLTGACGTCPSAQYTVEDVIKTILTEEFDEVTDVVLDTSVSDELLEMARNLMKDDR